MVAGFALGFSAPLVASDGHGGAANAAVCRALSAAEAALASLPDGRLKSFLAAQIDAAQGRYNCP
jgi:hypothetical protein